MTWSMILENTCMYAKPYDIIACNQVTSSPGMLSARFWNGTALGIQTKKLC